MKRPLLIIAALLGLSAPALSQTRALPPGEIRANGDITFGNALKLGKREGNKTVITPDTLQILGPGSTGDVSGMSVVPNAAAPETTLSGILANKAGLLSPALRGVPSITDIGRTSQNDNTPTLNIDTVEGLGFPSYVTHYGIYARFQQTSTGKGDRIGAGFHQICDATLAGKSCVGAALVAVAGGTGQGGYIAGNSVVKVPAGLPGPVTIAQAHEFNPQVHSPVNIRNGIRIADEAMSSDPVFKGSIEDAAIAIVTSNFHGVSNLGFRVGIQFGENPQGYPGNWPILAGGTIIQADNPQVKLDYGIDLKGSTAGFNNAAIALPVNSANGGISWGNNKQGGSIQSTATTSGPLVTFTNLGLFINNISSGASLLQINNGGAVGVPGTLEVSGGASVQNLTRRGALLASDVVKASPASGAIITMTGNYTKLVLDPATSLSSLTIRLPATPANGQTVEISATQNVTGLTIDGQGKPIANAVSALNTGPLGKVSYTYIDAAGAWYP